MIECPICPVIWERFKNYFLDMRKGFTKDFITKNYHKHLGYSFVLTIPTIMFLMQYAHLADTGLFFQTFVGGFGAYGVNFVREWYYGKKYNAPWDETDLNFGSYGGILGALVAVFIYSML
jgi:hypothetical protein